MKMMLWVIAVFIAAVMQMASADPYVIPEGSELIKADEQLAKTGDASLGDNVDLYTGTLSFRQTDVSIPGNSSLPVALTRKFTAANLGPRLTQTQPFYSWDLEVPKLSMVYATAQPWPSNRCSGKWRPPGISYVSYDRDAGTQKTTTFSSDSYFRGYTIDLPGRSAMMLYPPTAAPLRSDFIWVASGNMGVTCTSAHNADGSANGEGFVVWLPDGSRYVMNLLILQDGKNVEVLSSDDRVYTPIRRVYAQVLATQAIDRFGNTVNYNYDTSGRLTSITSSDNRSLALSWTNITGSNNATYNVISSVTDQANHVWQYQYGGRELTGVVRPDGSRWTFSLADVWNAYASASDLDSCGGCNVGGTVTSPYGLTGTFNLGEYIHPHARTPYRHTPQQPVNYYVYGLSSKQLSGPNYPSQTWTYSYTLGNGWSAVAPAESGPDTVATDVTDPAGTDTRYTYNVDFDWHDGDLEKVEVFPSGSSAAASTIVNTYVQTNLFGQTGVILRNDYRDADARRLSSSVLTRDGDTYTTSYDSVDTYKDPTQVSQSNGFSNNSRVETRSYYSNSSTTTWIVGQLSGTSYGGTQVSQTNYNSLGMPQDNYAFGLLTDHRDYGSDGTQSDQLDGLNRTTKLENYTRGKPQKITLPDNNIVYQTVSTNGTVTAFTDPNSATTGLAYDGLNRLISVTYPTSDTVNWSGRTISYTTLTASELGMPVGTFRARSVVGRQQKTTYYDAVLHPVLIEQKDTTTGEVRYAFSQYDFRGNVIFTAYPSSSPDSTTGVYAYYDSLGRVTSSKLSDGTVVKTIGYLSGNRQSVTDATGHSTISSFLAYGKPASDAPLTIVAPEGQTTSYTRNAFGEVTSATRSGSSGASITESSIYDANHRLCKVIRPESGQHVIGFDAANQMTWSASGVGGSTSSCDYGSVPSSTMTSFTYNSVGKPTLIHYPDSTGDINLGYDADGHLTSSSNSAAGWTYSYNKRGLVELETLSIDGKSFVLDPGYDTLGNMSQETYPDGLVAQYAPDAWGEDTTINAFATINQRHPTGRIKTATLGNGLSYATSLDARMRLSGESVAGGGGTLQSLSFGYNDDAQITSVTDNVDGSDTASYGYDGLHRLTTANGLWGNYGYSYDGVGNMVGRSGPNALTYTYDSVNNRLGTVAGGVSRTYGYDARGRVTSDGRFGYSWNLADQITGEPGTASYAYDGNAKRVKTTLANGTVEYAFYDPSGKLRYTLKSGVGTDYLDLDGQTFVERTTAGTVIYLHPDWIGSPRMASNASGAVLWREHYDPYGKKLNGVLEKRGYTGHSYDQETGNTYMQARYYDADVGRFLMTDPIGSKDDLNLYAYAGDDPIGKTDPTGTSADGPSFLTVDCSGGAGTANCQSDTKVTGYDKVAVIAPNKADGGLAGVMKSFNESLKASADSFSQLVENPSKLPGFVMDTLQASPAGAEADMAAVAAVKIGSKLISTETVLSDRLTYLYQKVSATGGHLKFGVTVTPATRYTAEELAGGKLRIIAQGSRSEMLNLERDLHLTLPIGPEERQSFYVQKQIDQGLLPPPYN